MGVLHTTGHPSLTMGSLEISYRGRSPATKNLFGLDIGVVDDLPVLRHFAINKCGKLVRRRADGFEAERVQPRLNVGLRQHAGDTGLQLGGNVSRKILWSPKAIPRLKLESRQTRFLDSRNFRRRGLPFQARDGERFDAAGLRQRQRRQHRIGQESGRSSDRSTPARCPCM